MKGHSMLAAAAAAVLHYTATVSALASTSTGSNGDIRFQWGVPEAVASSGSGNVYFQLEAPTSYAWVGLGTGSEMRGSQMFVMYTDGNGNVTLSTREGTGHVLPDHVKLSNTELLAGSGIANGKMVANVRCGDLQNLDLAGTNSWNAAWRSGNALDSTNVNYAIAEHDGTTRMRVKFGNAGITSDENPFLTNVTNSDSGNGAVVSSGGSSDNSGSSQGGGGSNTDAIILAHGIVALVVFAFLYPLGAILMRLVGNWYIHSLTQSLAWLAMWAAFGLGYVAANSEGEFFNQTHTILGTVVIALLGIQPLLGWLHHHHYLNHQKRGFVSHIHIWYGHILLVLGVINGGIGIQWMDSSTGFKIAYGVVAVVMFVAYIAFTIFSGIRKRRRVSGAKISPIDSTELSPIRSVE
ncbi:uncharacterized protein F5Z01DRAFT_160486 [Emericellopsis atlantica]|uniref:DOMON domain-containing protein n=1 Tax=Emericellopsis atlantica TaxID=2614577 RepID=A0A9P8CQ07_9HYPO|nr:uncharacterized protein F5Z01DRAFT_160486 [Emericellopsis atlantica]KAG9253261.1 hypothetical protein F5Z01DRAFT_160486 [Emericellopsis atlantica]